MNYGDPATTWAVWSHDNADRDEATRYRALKEYIFEAFAWHVARYNITAAWANKKLTKLGIAEQIPSTYSYTIEVPVQGTATRTVTASSRDEAARIFRESMASTAQAVSMSGITLTAPISFITGPYDPDPTAVNPDAPATVDDLLVAFREVAMLGHIAGPKYCEHGVNQVLAAFGLDPIPARQQYVVTRPAETTMRTVVSAYDEESAQRVAEWRWENARSGFDVAAVDSAGDFAVDVN